MSEQVIKWILGVAGTVAAAGVIGFVAWLRSLGNRQTELSQELAQLRTQVRSLESGNTEMRGMLTRANDRLADIVQALVGTGGGGAR